MKLPNTKLLIPALAAVLMGATSASAEVIYIIDYDSNTSNYSQNDSSAAPVKDHGTFSYTPGSNTNGVGGTNALSLDWDATTAAPSDNYQFKLFTNKNSTANLATTDDLSLLSLDFSLFVAGQVASPDPIKLAVSFSGNKSADKNISPVNGSYTNYSFALSDFTFASAPTLGDINGGLQVVIESGWDKGDNVFGWDSGNSIHLDNVSVNQAIPEPSSVILLLVAGGALLFYRRKK
ncbi:PEP-CTERM sorting domain-containing protein [Kiritimatiellota bacterium B12222]|nr:PEP-CTERM sorting domain-containing protein [Kiritimatiellota bacterium B12222]